MTANAAPNAPPETEPPAPVPCVQATGTDCAAQLPASQCAGADGRPAAGPASASENRQAGTRKKRVWALALGSAAVWHVDPALAEMAEMVVLVACAGNKSLVGDAIASLRVHAQGLRARIEPLPASALAKVVRRSEAACGAVIDKGARIQELQASWDHFVACLRARADAQEPSPAQPPR